MDQERIKRARAGYVPAGAAAPRVQEQNTEVFHVRREARTGFYVALDELECALWRVQNANGVCERLLAQNDGVVFGDLMNCIFHGYSFFAAPGYSRYALVLGYS